MIRYVADPEDSRVVWAVECAERGYPHKDAEGKTQYDNTHFDTLEEARARARTEADAIVFHAAQTLLQARAALRKAEARAAEAALVAARTTAAIGGEDWKLRVMRESL